MPKIIQLSSHVANLIAAGEVVERPASVVKELLENAVDAGASKVTVEIRNGGMTFLRVTDDGCGMTPEDARTAFLRHATSKLRCAEDLGAISTMGFRGEALAAIASVSRIDLLTKTPGALSGVSLTLEAGAVLEESEAGCPDGTTIVVRDLFYNTPARMKFMKSDSVEGGKVAAAVQLQALAHPEVSFCFIRDGKQTLLTPGTGDLGSAVYCVYGRESAKLLSVDSRWEGCHVTGFVSKPTDSRPSRSLQTFFVNDRPVRSRLLIQALEEAYRNRLMVGKFPVCVLRLTLPANAVDVNVHPAKTEVKFLSEKTAFDCVHYGVLAALNQAADRPAVQLSKPAPTPSVQPSSGTAAPAKTAAKSPDPGHWRTMTAQEYRELSAAMEHRSQPQPSSAAAVLGAIRSERAQAPTLRQSTPYPKPEAIAPSPPAISAQKPAVNVQPSQPQTSQPQIAPAQPEQTAIAMPDEPQWRLAGELFRSYVVVEQGDDAFLIDKHAAHERILFEKLRAAPHEILSQTLLSPISLRLPPDRAAVLLSRQSLLRELGFEIEEFGENTLLIRQIPMDLAESQAQDTLMEMADGLLSGKGADTQTMRDELLHTMACKAAIKAGWKTDAQELEALVRQVMSRPELKYCPHGRPICITLSKRQLEKQFRRT